MPLHRCLPLLAALVACTPPVDEDLDGDGFPAHLDCDDTNAQIFPDQLEVPYDGIDNGCRGFDAVDLDADGYAGISFFQYAENLDLPPSMVVWPSSVSRTQWDCDDFAVQVHPNALSEQPYDGIDQDCLGDNDFDVDRDGQMPLRIRDQPTLPMVLAYIERWPHLEPIDLEDENAFRDCDDFDSSVRTGAGDAPYDGVDSNCDGDNDFDQDEDGYYPGNLADAFAAYVLEAYPDDAPDGPSRWAAPGQPHALPGDCVDAPIASLPQLLPADLNPAAQDTWYDGIDSNCDGANDFDQDMDGFHPDAYQADWEDFLWMWTLLGTSPGQSTPGDCNDIDAATHPDAGEVLFDGIDSDCDGQPDGAPFTFDRIAWTAPGQVRLGRTSSHLVAAVTAEAWNPIYATEADLEHPGIAMVFPSDLQRGESPEQVLHWGGVREKEDAALAVWEDGFATANIAHEPGHGTRLQLQQWSWSTDRFAGDGSQATIYPSATTGFVFVEAEDATTAAATWCGPDGPTAVTLSGVAVANGEGCTGSFQHGTLEVSLTNGLTVQDGTQTWSFFPGEHVESGDAVWADESLIVVAVVDRGDHHVALWGATQTPQDGVTAIELAVHDDDPVFEHDALPGCYGPECTHGRNLDPASIAIESGDGRVLVVVSAVSLDTPTMPRRDAVPIVQDAVGWAVLTY